MMEEANMRNIRALSTLTLSVALALAACEGAEAPSPTAGPTATPAAQASSGPSATPAASETAFDLAALEADAKAEGAVTFYTVQTPATNDAVKAAFEKEYPEITVTIEQVTGSELKTKFLAELQSGTVLADVVAIGEYKVFEEHADALGILSDLPTFEAFPSEYRTNKYVLTSLQAKHIIVNTTIVSPADLKSYQDLTDPKYKGLIGIASPRVSRAGASFFWLLSKTYGEELLTGIAANEPLYQPGGGNIVNLVSAGEKAIGLPIVDSLISPALKSGAPLAVVELDPEGGAEIWSVLPAQAPHPNAGRLMLNFLMSEEGQLALNGDGRGSSVLTDIPTAAPVPKYYVPTDESITDATIDHVATLMGVP
jgi:iron(III) transport system substrate-binding protein